MVNDNAQRVGERPAYWVDKWTQRSPIRTRSLLKLTLLIVTALPVFSRLSTANAVETRVVPVVVFCRCNDLVGEKLCYALREAIRRSAGFELVEDSARNAFGVHITCLDTAMDGQEKGLSTAVSTVYAITNSNLEIYLSNDLFIVGTQRTDMAAKSIMSDIDRMSEPWSKNISRPHSR